jgi:hypothetical protein
MERPARREDGSELYPDRRVTYNNVTAARVGREPGSDRVIASGRGYVIVTKSPDCRSHDSVNGS